MNPLRVFKIPSESNPRETHKVQWDGHAWYCDCMSWRFNYEHKGEKGPDGRSIQRSCKHTRQAQANYQLRGEAAGQVIHPIGPWFEQLQEYVASMVEIVRNGRIPPEKLAAFHADFGHFREETEKAQDAVDSAKTMLSVYQTLEKQMSEAV